MVSPRFSTAVAYRNSLNVSSTWLGLMNIISAFAQARNTCQIYMSNGRRVNVEVLHACQPFCRDIYTRGFADCVRQRLWRMGATRCAYRISREPEGLPYRIGKWAPLSTSNMSSAWGGTNIWARGRCDDQDHIYSQILQSGHRGELEWNSGERETGSHATCRAEKDRRRRVYGAQGEVRQ